MEPASNAFDLAGAVLRGLAQGWLPGLAWLDGGGFGRSFVGAEPDLVIEGDDIAQLDVVDERWRADPSRVWVGWLTYELGVDHLLGRRAGRGPRPGLCLRRYPAVIERELDGSEHIHGDPDAAQHLQAVLRRAAGAPLRDPPWPLEPLRPRLAPEEHSARLERARQLLVAGDTQQINLSQQFGARWKASAPPGTPIRVASAYASLRHRRPAAMGAVLEADADTWFLSNSPETLLDVRRDLGSTGEGSAEPSAGLLARSWPIKGTRPRDPDPERDAAAAQSLWHSDGDRALHRMIVELVRDDLGHIALPGTVQAAPEPQPLTLPTIHHLVTEVRATLPAALSLRSMVAAMFPGGSITGVPKRRTVELIDQLEEHARGIYCGAIVVLEPRGLSMSIPIRTGVVDRYGLTLCVGSSVLLDGDPESERQETLAKIAAFSAP
jgi:para-aminobenzoate synthetase component I